MKVSNCEISALLRLSVFFVVSFFLGNTQLAFAGNSKRTGVTFIEPKESWLNWANSEFGISPQSLWTSVMMDSNKPSSVEIFKDRRRSGNVTIEEGIVSSNLFVENLESKAFLEILSIFAIFEADPSLEKLLLDEKFAAQTEIIPGLSIEKLSRSNEILNEASYMVFHRSDLEIPPSLRELFLQLIAPRPVLPAEKTRLNFSGNIDPVDTFKKIGLDPEKIKIICTNRTGPDSTFDVDFFLDRYYIGSVSFANHPAHWEDYSGIPSTVFHGRGLGTFLYILAIFQLHDFDKKPVVSDGNRSGQAESVWRNLVAADIATMTLPNDSNGVATYRFRMEKLSGLHLIRDFSLKREVIEIENTEE